MRAGRVVLAPVIAVAVAFSFPLVAEVSAAPVAAASSGAAVTSSSASALVPMRASRTYKRTPTAGRYCPVIGATLGDGFGVSRGNHSHKGIDLMIGKGRRIFAVESGYVVRAGRQNNGALRIVLQGRSGSKYYYGHNSKHLVRSGQRVRAGQVIALTGDSGSPGTPHLHFEFWKSGGESAAVNPKPLVLRLCF